MIALAADNANVVGEYHSLATLFKKEMLHLFIMRCTCHSLAQRALQVAEKLLSEVENLLRNVYFILF